MGDKGYVDYFEVLGLSEQAKPGEVRKIYKRMMKNLVMEIARVEITEEKRQHYLLEMAKLNAALYVLRNNETRERYWRERQEVMALEDEWRAAAQAAGEKAAEQTDQLRRRFERKVRDFLARYVEETVLQAGRDKECVDASHWDAAHEAHGSRILRHYRQRAYQQILERLPYYDVTPPQIDWDERRQTVAAILAGGGA